MTAAARSAIRLWIQPSVADPLEHIRAGAWRRYTSELDTCCEPVIPRQLL
jgi:hypothetical protein